MIAAAYILLTFSIVPSIKGHGRLIEPPSRASAWRYGFNTPHNYNDHELYCGGFTRQWKKNEGKCGVCGDSWDTKLPRPHEHGGIYGQGVIVRKYGVGNVITIRVEITANHQGYFEFAICSNYKNTTQECLNKHLLKILRSQENVERSDIRYYPKDGNKVYEMRYRLPKISCEHCVLQWRYIAGNNWGSCPDGTEAVGCGPQEEFRACADITIAGKGAETTEVPLSPTTEIITTKPAQPPTLPEPEDVFSPITSFIIAIITFLIVILVLFLLYFHYYQVGRQVKGWLKGNSSKKADNRYNYPKTKGRAPMPPPRTKKVKADTENNNMQEVNLERESLA